MTTKLKLGFGALVVVGATLTLVISSEGPFPVPRGKIPQPVVVFLSRTNEPLRIFPGVGGFLMVLPDGSLWQWGEIAFRSRATVPQQVGTNCDWTQALAANNHCLALRCDGTLWEWGFHGYLAGSPQFSSVPQQMNPGHDWIGIAAGDIHSVALRRDGTVWAWGDNSVCQMGNGPGPNPTHLVQVGTNNDWTAIACGQGSHTFGIRKDGTLWVWGQIYWFGNGRPGAVYPLPTQVCRETNWTGFDNGPVACVWTETAELRDPFYAPPNPEAPATETTRLVATNFVSGRHAFAFVKRLKQYEIHPDGTLWEANCPWGREMTNLPSGYKWRQVDKRSDWISIWGTSTAMGSTADGTVWMWGLDLSQEPIPDTISKLALLRAWVMSTLRHGSMSLTTSASYPYQREPRPLMRLVPSDS